MFGILLVSLSTLLGEISSSIGKREVLKRLESIYTLGFLNIIWAVIFYVSFIFFWRGSFLFSAASLPTFGVRALFEILQAELAVRAVTRAERSTFSFLRTGTIPLLLGVDIFLGYSLRVWQFAGIGLIMPTLIFLSFSQSLNKRGIWFVVATSLNAVITITLFKYNITHFNSVEAEQLLISILLLFYFFISAYFRVGENPLRFFRKSIFLAQSTSHGAAGILQSFAYSFAPASIILAAERSTAVFWSVFSGRFYFREKHMAIKIISLMFLVAGIVMLTF